MIGLVPQLLGVAPEKAIKLTVSRCVRKRIDTRMHIHSDRDPRGSSIASIFWMDFILCDATHKYSDNIVTCTS